MGVNSVSEGLVGVESCGPGSGQGRDSGNGGDLGSGGDSRCGIAEALGVPVGCVSGDQGGFGRGGWTEGSTEGLCQLDTF